MQYMWLYCTRLNAINRIYIQYIVLYTKKNTIYSGTTLYFTLHVLTLVGREIKAQAPSNCISFDVLPAKKLVDKE